MAKIYLEKLSRLITKLDLNNEMSESIETKHFFSGAALYVGGLICATWTPVGLAFKLPDKDVNKLFDSSKAVPLKYFPKGPVKKGYALFKNPNDLTTKQCKKYLKLASKKF